MRVFYYIKRFWEIPRLEKRLFIKGIQFCTILPLIIRLIPLKYYKIFLPKGNGHFNEETELEKEYLKSLRKSMKRVGKFCPFKLTCLSKGIIFKVLSDSIGLNYLISFAAIKLNNGNLVAHAFISRGNKIIYLPNSQFNETTPLFTI